MKESQKSTNQPPSALDIVAEYSAALGAGDSERMNACLAEDFKLDFVQQDAFQEEPLSRSETKEFWPSWFASFPEMDYQITRTIAAETVVVTQWAFTATNSGPLTPPVFDHPRDPTGRTICFRGVSIYDVKNGLIQLETTYMDLGTLLVELGVTL